MDCANHSPRFLFYIAILSTFLTTQRCTSNLNLGKRMHKKQRGKNEQLQKKIASDISSQATKLAHEKGYGVIFKKYKVNISADDITTQVINGLPK